MTVTNSYLTDINECAIHNGNCSQICTNEMGSYTCSCISGYALNADKSACNGMLYPILYS